MANQIRVCYPSQRRPGVPDPPTLVPVKASPQRVRWVLMPTVSLPEAPDADLLNVMHRAYIQVPNEPHQERLVRVYRAFVRALKARQARG